MERQSRYSNNVKPPFLIIFHQKGGFCYGGYISCVRQEDKPIGAKTPIKMKKSD